MQAPDADSRFASDPYFRTLANVESQEVFTAGALLMVLAVGVFMEKLGISMALGAPNSSDRSIFKPPAFSTSLPAIPGVLCCGKMIAFPGQTRLHAGHPLRQLSGCSTRIVSARSTPYTPNRQKSMHSMQFVQRL